MVSANKVVLSGSLATGTESWSTGFYCNGNTGFVVNTPAALGTWAAAVATDFTTLLGTALKNGLSSAGAIQKVDIYYYPDIAGPAAAVGTATNFVAGLTTAKNPLPTAAVATLETGLAGRSYRGRMYWPALAWTVSASGLFAGTEPANFRTEIADMIEGICTRAPGEGGFKPVVASRTRGVVTDVTAVSNDTIPDTQRSRRDNLVGVRSRVVYPTP